MKLWDQHTLLTLSAVMQHVKKNSLPLGGVQRILCGDFHQLSPIPNIHNGDAGLPLFAFDEIAKFIPHKVELIEVITHHVFVQTN